MSKASRDDEMAQPLDRLGRADQPPVQRRDGLALLAHGAAAADRAVSRGTRRARRFAAAASSTTSTTCGITSPARCMMTVSPTRMSLRAISSSLCSVALRDHDAADRDRLQLGDRRQRAGAADLDRRSLEHRLGLLGRELVRDRPARRAADEAQPLLPVEPVDLVDDAVDVVGRARRARSPISS